MHQGLRIVHEYQFSLFKRERVCKPGNFPGSFLDFHINFLLQFFLYRCGQYNIIDLDRGDDTSYILRTYNYLQAATGGKIIGIVVFPMTRESGLLGGYGEMRAVSEEELSVFSDKLKAVIDCNVYLLGKEMDILCNGIIDYFAEG